MVTDEVRRAVETAARNSYGRLVSYLSARWRDVAQAEDALADAFVAALRTWPRDGVPGNPDAWLLTAARNRLVDRARHDSVRAAALETWLALEQARELSDASVFPDKRLELLFVCAHPAIDRAVHTPLMLQVVLGLDAATIAEAFLVRPSTMGQRLSRAKAKIRLAGIAFEVPTPADLPPRLEAVLEAVYAAYGTGWDDLAGTDPARRELTGEAVWLARVLVGLLPDEPEIRGVLALLLYCEARRPARRGPSGDYVPISEQDTTLWSEPLIAEGDALLAAAAKAGCPGRFQLEAAIQSAHVERMRGREVDWEAIATLYEGLVHLAPAAGAFVGRAAAVAEARGADAGLRLLDEVPGDARMYQPYWAVRAHLLQRLGRHADALDAFERALGMTRDESVRTFLRLRRERVGVQG